MFFFFFEPMSGLKVWYGFEKLSKVKKKRALVVIFENSTARYARKMKYVERIKPIYERNQTAAEAEGAVGSTREFALYRIFIDGKPYNGDIESVLQQNFEADSNNVSFQ